MDNMGPIIKNEKNAQLQTLLNKLDENEQRLIDFFRINRVEKIALVLCNDSEKQIVDATVLKKFVKEITNENELAKDKYDVVIIVNDFSFERLKKYIMAKYGLKVWKLDELLTEIVNTPIKLDKDCVNQMLKKEIKSNNIYDLREKEHLYSIFPKKDYIGLKEERSLFNKRIIIVVNLYYVTDVQGYLNYLYDMPESIDVCIATSKESIYNIVREAIAEKNISNIKVLKKKNRGRDISALLVATRDMLKNYEYVCFLHDKKEKFAAAKPDNDFWIENLWGNMIGSKNYVANVIDTFENNSTIGVIAPPEPAGMYQNAWYKSAWGSSFQVTCSLAKRLGLKCNISRKKPPITLGTVFWCRYEALRKLFEIDWKYEDFDEEPLKDDGTLSHAIERIIGYVAQDAGFETTIAMNNEYAAKLFALLQVNVQKTFEYLVQQKIENFHDIDYFYNLMPRVMDVFDKYENVYMYGTGLIGMKLYNQIKQYGMKPNAFLETKCEKNKMVDDIPVLEIDKVKLTEKDIVIISVGIKLQPQIKEELEKRGYKNYVYGLEMLMNS